jgi:hypothetical protein
MAEKKEYRITFRVKEYNYYQTDVEAETPEDAIRIFKEDPHDTDSEGRSDWNDYATDGTDGIDQIECEGYWEPEEPIPGTEASTSKFHYIEPVVPDPNPDETCT